MPLPETPVTAVSTPSGISTSIFFKLFSLAPRMRRLFPFPLRRFEGTGIFLAPERYWPVMLRGSAQMSSTVPWATTSPPWTPAPGPMSTIQSAARIVSSSCSTTISVLPRSRSSFSVLMSLSLSRWCSPMLGSSRM